MAQQPSDAGRTSGGGNLGHDQPRDVADQTPLRNDPRAREDKDTPSRDELDERGQKRGPVMPADDSTLNTKI
jgi:hypothetical protein